MNIVQSVKHQEEAKLERGMMNDDERLTMNDERQDER
jgi:hypothetical protein